MNDRSSSQQVIACEPNWNDVIARGVRIRRRTMVRKVGAAVALTIVLLVAAAPALGVGGWLRDIVHGTPVSPSRLTAADVRSLSVLADHSHPVALTQLASPRVRQQALDRFGLEGIRLLAVRSGVSFYAIDVRGGGQCFATGRGSAQNLFSSVECASATRPFPSPAEPVLDQSIVGNAGAAHPSLVELAGIAADGVASVGVEGPDGAVYARTPVHSNVFVNDSVPAHVTGPLVAFDAAGRRLWTQIAQPKCRIKLYFGGTAKNSQIVQTIAALKREPEIVQVTFVSRAAALKYERKHFPELVEGLAYNPLPDSIVVRPRAGVSAKTLMAKLRTRHLPGISVIQNRGC